MSIVDSAVSALQSAMTSAGNTAEEWSQSWENAKNDLIGKAQEFSSVYNDLSSQADTAASDPALYADYADLMQQGAAIKSIVSSITQNFDSAANWFNNTLSTLTNAIGLNGLPNAPLRARQLAGLRGMGQLVVIGAAVIVAATAAIVAWLSSAYELKTKLDFISKSGASGSNVNKLVDSLFGSSSTLTGTAKNIAIIGAIGVGIYFAWPYLKKLGMK